MSRREVWLAFVLAFALTLGVGLRGRLVDAQVNWDGVAAVAHAHDVFRAQENANLAMIGFVQPPLPALLQLPVVLIVPSLATSGLAANFLGALCAAGSVAILLGLSADCGLSRRWRWPLVAVFALHPLVLGPAACGAPMALLTTLLLGAAWALLRWRRNESLRDLIVTSFLLAGALITRYEAVFILLGAMIYLGWRTWRDDRSWEKLEGTMITFTLPIIYVSGIWIIANWAIMGDPWFFARETFDLIPSATAEQMLTILLRVSLAAFFPVLALIYHQMRGAGRDPASARPIAWMVVTAMVAPAIFPSLFAGLGEDGAWANMLTPLAMILAGGFAMLAAVIGDRLEGRPQQGPIQGTIFVLVASFGVAAWLWTSGGALPLSPRRAFLGQGPLTAEATHELEAAQLLSETKLQDGRRHLIAGWPGFAVALYARRTGDVNVIRTPQLAEFVDRLWVGSTVVLLIGKEESAIPPERVEAGLGLTDDLALEHQWHTGPWGCFQVRRASAIDP